MTPFFTTQCNRHFAHPNSVEPANSGFANACPTRPAAKLSPPAGAREDNAFRHKASLPRAECVSDSRPGSTCVASGNLMRYAASGGLLKVRPLFLYFTCLSEEMVKDPFAAWVLLPLAGWVTPWCATGANGDAGSFFACTRTHCRSIATASFWCAENFQNLSSASWRRSFFKRATT